MKSHSDLQKASHDLFSLYCSVAYGSKTNQHLLAFYNFLNETWTDDYIQFYCDTDRIIAKMSQKTSKLKIERVVDVVQ